MSDIKMYTAGKHGDDGGGDGSTQFRTHHRVVMMTQHTTHSRTKHVPYTHTHNINANFRSVRNESAERVESFVFGTTIYIIIPFFCAHSAEGRYIITVRKLEVSQSRVEWMYTHKTGAVFVRVARPTLLLMRLRGF